MNEVEVKGKETSLSKAVVSGNNSVKKIDADGTPGTNSERETPAQGMSTETKKKEQARNDANTAAGQAELLK